MLKLSINCKPTLHSVYALVFRFSLPCNATRLRCNRTGLNGNALRSELQLRHNSTLSRSNVTETIHHAEAVLGDKALGCNATDFDGNTFETCHTTETYNLTLSRGSNNAIEKIRHAGKMFGGNATGMNMSSNGTHTPPPSFCIGSLPSKTAGIVFYSVVLLLSLIGNSLIVAVFFRNKALKTPVHYFIANMAISDLLIPVVVLPWQISDTHLGHLWLIDGVLGRTLCKFVGIARGISPCVSILSMVAIAFERFYAILFAMKGAPTSQKTCSRVIAAIWVTAVAMRGHYFYAYKLFRYNDSNLFCVYRWSPPTSTNDVLKINWVFFLCLCTVSAIILTTLYSTISVVLCRQKNNIYMATETIKRRTVENRKVVCMLVITVAFFNAVYMPYHINAFWFYRKPRIKVPCPFLWAAKHAHFLYTVFNPFAYCVFSQHYRQGFLELLGCLWLCNHRNKSCNFVMHQRDANETTLSGQSNVTLKTLNFSNNLC